MFVEVFPKLVNLLASLALGTAFLLIARKDLRGQVRLFAAQSFFVSILAGVIAVFARSAELFGVALGLALLKVFIIPAILNRAVSRIGLQRAVAPYLGTPAALLVCGVLVAIAFYVMAPITASNPLPTAGAVPVAFAGVLIGAFITVIRRRALTQILGFLMLENGISLLALLATYGVPFIVEIGVFLDVLVAVLIMEVFIYRIKENFDSIEVGEMGEIEGMILVTLLLIPAVAAGSIALLRNRGLMEVIHVLAALATLVTGVTAAMGVWRGKTEIIGLDHLLRADALSALVVTLVTLLGAIAAIYGSGYIRAEFDAEHTKQARIFFSLSQVFIFTMLLAVTTDNLGVMWVAIEATTLATVFLVNLHNTQTSLEAAYKYLILSSVGIALAFIGTVLMYYAGSAESGEIAVNWTSLHAAASSLNPQVVRLAFVFILVGYGTKAGLAPMHTWLPDAHSEAPAPISALMSGVLLNVGLYALVRFKSIVDITLGASFSSRLLLGIGLFSLAVASAFLLTQRNYKRMLAYSSVEHMGIICLGLGFGGYWGVFGALLHVINHALSKSLLFMLSGNILLKYRTTDISRVRGLLRAAPLTGGAFLAGTLALVGLPPFGPFISEFIIFRAGIERHAWVTAIGIALLVVVFAGMLASVNQMLYGEPPDKMGRGDVLKWSIAPLAVNFAMLVALGLTLPSALIDALKQAIAVLGG